MRPIFKTLVALATVLALSACATAHRLTAANDVHALLVSIRDNDRTAFDAHVDRKALQDEIAARLAEQGRKSSSSSSLGALSAMLAPSLAQFAGDALIQPKVFRQVADYYGYRADTQIPNALVIAGSLKALPDGRVCATKKKNGPCMLMFTQEQGVWRLTGFEGDTSMLRIKL
jgi:hypothetical protein